MPSLKIRHLAAAALAVAALLASGCGQAGHRTGGTDKVRVHGARLLEADPEADMVPAVEEPVAPETPEPARRDIPSADVAKGVKVSLDVVDGRAIEVLRGLAYQGDVDLVVLAGADKRITVRLQNMPWAEAFNAVLAGSGLVAEWDGRRVRVLSQEQQRAEQETADRLERQRPRTQVVLLQNLLAEDAAKALVSMMSEIGRIGIDEERNALIVSDTPTRVDAVRRTLRDLDRLPAQVMIEAIIVDVTLDDALKYGFDWTATHNTGDPLTLLQTLTTGSGLGAAVAPGANLAYTFMTGNWTIKTVYDLLQTVQNVKILANPKVVAINNRKANIEIIDEIPYQELTQTSNGGQIGTTNFKEVGIKLDVKPRIAEDGSVHLEVAAEESAPTSANINQVPVIQTRRSSSIMSVDDGQIVVLGGLRRHRSIKTEDKVPILGDLPLLGAFFRRMVADEVETELVIFIRPKIVRRAQGLTERERTLAEALDHVDHSPQVIKTDPLRIEPILGIDRGRTIP
jgi:type IV pilus secretin PilQ/predicted competence protein